jgi:hypothetical protein
VRIFGRKTLHIIACPFASGVAQREALLRPQAAAPS